MAPARPQGGAHRRTGREVTPRMDFVIVVRFEVWWSRCLYWAGSCPPRTGPTARNPGARPARAVEPAGDCEALSVKWSRRLGGRISRVPIVQLSLVVRAGGNDDPQGKFGPRV